MTKQIAGIIDGLQARPNTKMARAIEIFKSHLNKPHAERVKACVEQFKTELFPEDERGVIARRYLQMINEQLEQAIQRHNETIIQSKRKSQKPVSVVKTEYGKNNDTAQLVALFLSASAAREFNEQLGFDHVVKGVQTLGKPVGTVAAA